MTQVHANRSGRRCDTKEAAAYMGLSPRTLEQLRLTGGGPKFLKIGSRVIYDLDLIDEYLACHIVSHTSELMK